MINKAPRILVDHGGEKGLGDIVCELSVYSALRERHPEALLVSRGTRSLAWGNPLIDAFDESSPDEAFDQVISLESGFRQLGQSLADGRTIFEHFMHVNGLALPLAPPKLHVLPDELEAIGLEPDSPDDLIIAYSVDSKEPDRRWGEERFAELIRHVQATYGGTFIELGAGFTAGHVGIGYDLVGQTDLRQTMALLSGTDLFIGNHGGLTHLAGGVGTPILCPWGASNPYAAYAYDPVSIALETEPACRHCAWTGAVTPACRETSVFAGRTACTQEITVAQMIEAADRLIPELMRNRERLRAAREERRREARDARRIEHFEPPQGLNPYDHMRLFLGGRPGWGAEHRKDHFARLRKIVAFPDWHNPTSAWESLISTYVSTFDADDAWVLVLSAAPLAGPEARNLLSDYVRLLERDASLPKIMLILGRLSETDRRDLIRQAEAYVPLEGPYHLEGESGRYVTQLHELAALGRA